MARPGTTFLMITRWNEKDPILKERFFGLTNSEGNHGEDVKEYYFYLDSTPSHSYMKALYRYPQAEYPYQRIVEENRRRGKNQPEFELIHTGIFDQDRYFDIFVEYAKADVNDILIRIRAVNRGPDQAPLHLLPTLWFRNTWSWGSGDPKPSLGLSRASGPKVIAAEHASLGKMWLASEGDPEVLFSENESNAGRLFGTPNASPYVKDSFHSYVIGGDRNAVNPAQAGTKAAARYKKTLAPGETWVISLRLSDRPPGAGSFGAPFESAFAEREREADAFYNRVAFTIMSSSRGSTAIRPDSPHPPAGSAAATASGRMFSLTTSSPCRTTGSIRGLPRGISRSTAFLLPWSTRSSQSSNSSCSRASGTCTRTGSSPPTSGLSMT